MFKMYWYGLGILRRISGASEGFGRAGYEGSDEGPGRVNIEYGFLFLFEDK